MKWFPELLVKEFTWKLNRELTLEEINFLRWVAFNFRSETGKKRGRKRVQAK